MEERSAEECGWIRRVSALNEALGHAVRWLVLAVVLIGAGNALARYAGKWFGMNLTSNFWLELQWYLFSLVFLLGAAYTLHHNGHVRVDVFYTRLGPRGRAWTGLLGTVLFLIPFCLLMIVSAWPAVRNSWAIHELSPDPGGLPRYPIKTFIPIAFLLVLIQGIAELVRHVRTLRGRAPAEATEEPKVSL